MLLIYIKWDHLRGIHYMDDDRDVSCISVRATVQKLTRFIRRRVDFVSISLRCGVLYRIKLIPFSFHELHRTVPGMGILLDESNILFSGKTRNIFLHSTHSSGICNVGICSGVGTAGTGLVGRAPGDIFLGLWILVLKFQSE